MGDFARSVIANIRETCRNMSRFHHREYLDELKAHRSQCMENLRDSEGSTMVDYWRLRVELIDTEIVAVEDPHWSDAA